MTGGSSIHAMTRHSPPHLGQRRTFTPKTRAINSAHKRLRRTDAFVSRRGVRASRNKVPDTFTGHIYRPRFMGHTQ